ncbi:DUF3781 domain-containing protein [Persicobacter sp. CCB-QB2]|uniref:DUF3781 domain-containing protein n=1 Tax=Persicobacter sp. CCB-QB2 TaxID=1561025 RepID=UPI0006A9FBA7|nr:DUF3781 domain-containing protein [Persicobacter sp. CCB-QB2]
MIVITFAKRLIIRGICYTPLVYGRINKKLGTTDSNSEIEEKLYAILKDSPEENFHRKGKNFYVSNAQHNIRITINAYTYRVITVDRLDDLR